VTEEFVSTVDEVNHVKAFAHVGGTEARAPLCIRFKFFSGLSPRGVFWKNSILNVLRAARADLDAPIVPIVLYKSLRMQWRKNSISKVCGVAIFDPIS
jgi:hypothetical protein